MKILDGLKEEIIYHLLFLTILVISNDNIPTLFDRFTIVCKPSSLVTIFQGVLDILNRHKNFVIKQTDKQTQKLKESAPSGAEGGVRRLKIMQ